ncbi:MAG TPA: ATP-binding protein, partial [Euzebya sp.]|nr:ATP-binding protein [Euzebya sp.]
MGVEQSVPLVGRTQELERSLAALDRLGGGRGGLISLVGDRGVGKSAVAGAMTEEAVRRGMATAWGRPMAGRRGDTPYGAWGRALDRLGIRMLTEGQHSAEGYQPLGLDEARGRVLQVVDRPTVLVLDDLHRADDESRWLVE